MRHERPEWVLYRTPSHGKLSRPHALRLREGDDAVFECGLRLPGAWMSSVAFAEGNAPLPPSRIYDLGTLERTFLMPAPATEEAEIGEFCKGCLHEIGRARSLDVVLDNAIAGLRAMGLVAQASRLSVGRMSGLE